MRAGFNVCKNASIIAILCIFQLTLADDFHICLDGKHHKEQPTPERNLKQVTNLIYFFHEIMYNEGQSKSGSSIFFT